MVKEETWSLSIGRVRAFFRAQDDVTEENGDCYVFRSCYIRLTELEPRRLGSLPIQRLKLRLEGGDADVETIYHRFFIQFLSAGG